MRKLVVASSLLVLFWIAKLNYDVLQNTKQLQELQTRILHSEQANANVNDQVVALQRQFNDAPTASTVATSNAPLANQQSLNPTILVKQQLQLVQFALQQQQEVYAFEQLQKLNQDIANYQLSPALQQLPREQALRGALSGGDDYRLLFTLPPEHLSTLQAQWPELAVLGRVEAGGAEVRLLAEDGRELPQPAGGYQHFGQDRD